MRKRVQMLSAPVRYNPLFRGTDAFRTNACVGRNGGPYHFDDYARGYFAACRRTLEAAIDQRDYVDLAVYPAVLLFRHGIELGLKAVTRQLSLLLGKDFRVSYTHNLVDNWRTVKKGFRQLRPSVGIAPGVKEVNEAIECIVAIDPSGEAFRYPEDRRERFFLQDQSLVNLEVLLSSLDSVENSFEIWFSHLDHLCEMLRLTRRSQL